MGSARWKFGHIELELQEDGASDADDVPRSQAQRFGEIDLDAIGDLADAADKEDATCIQEGDPAWRQDEHDDVTRLRSADYLAPPSRRGMHGSSTPPSREDERVDAIRELYAQGNTDAALSIASELASELDAVDPFGGLIPVDDENHTAIAHVSVNTARLAAMTSRRVPRVLIGPTELAKLPMDPRAGVVLARVDGVRSMERILDECAMSESEGLELFSWLHALGAISFD
jgi:hypothetical protein